MIDLKNPGRAIRVGVVLTNSTTEILDVAPIDIFSGISKEFLHNFPDGMITEKMRQSAWDVEYHWVNESGNEAKCTAGAVIRPTASVPTRYQAVTLTVDQHTFQNCPPLDIVLMGAHDAGYVMTEREINFLQKCNEDCAALLFVCGGFLAALSAGLLEGKTATAPRPMVERLCASNPEVNWVTKRWANDGKIWTSGALLNGTDMTSAFATKFWGGEGTFTEFGLRLGGYPNRDVDYADVPWVL